MPDNLREPTEGMRVLGVDKHEIGTVKEVHRDDIVVGRTLQPAVRVPREAIQHLGADHLVLRIAADKVDDLWWEHAGEDVQVDTSGTYD